MQLGMYLIPRCAARCAVFNEEGKGLMEIDLNGKTAIVTGGSRGIGRDVCRMLAQSGARICISYQSREAEARELRDEIQSGGGKAIAVKGDVRLHKTFEDLFQQTREELGPIDIAVGNAGIWKRAPIDEMSQDEWQEMIDVNLKSIYWLCHFAARDMKSRRSGNIILVGSTAGQRGEAFYSHYAATKGAIHAITKSLAAELGPEGIRVNCVAPGWVDTDMCAEAFANPNFRQALRKATPLRQIASSEQIASTVLFLASDMASHVQGEILNVNGGTVLCG